MQDDSLESSTSISQLLRESYLAETKHQGRSERSRSEPASHNFHYGNASGDSDEVAVQDDLPDLSAFLSQEELDQSVNLARQAIDQNPLETKQDELHAQSQCPPDQLKNTEKHKQMAQSAALKTSDNGLHSNFCQDHVRNTKSSKGSSQDLKKHLPSESESKKEFLNKAADFIEELSSLFKAHNSERIRPRTCKNYRSKIDSKNKPAQKGSSSLCSTSDNRERLSIPIPQDLENKAEKTFEQTDDQQASNLESINQLTSTELKPESESASVYSDEPIGQPPRFTQKLKSREVPEGTKVQLDCIVVGIPAPEVRWYCEGKELENSPDIQIIQAGDQHSLVIVEAFEEDTGRYSCFASNIYGTDSTSAEIYIEGVSSSDSEGEIIKDEMDHKPKQADTSLNAVRTATKHQETSKTPSAMVQPVSTPVNECSIRHHHVMFCNLQAQSPTNYLQGLDGRPIIAAPVFTKMLQDISASEGQLVVFECRVKGAPSPKVEWYREGTLIEDSPDFRILQKKPRSMAEPGEDHQKAQTFLVIQMCDQSQLKQLHNQVLLEQQQVHQTSTRELLFSTAVLNSTTSLNQQSTSTVYKQSKASASQAFSYSRPKQFLPSQTSPPTSSSSSSSVATFSNIPQGTQRTNNKENFTGNPLPAQSRSSGGFTSKSEQSLPSPKESMVTPPTLSTSSVNQFQPQSVTPVPISPTGWIQNPAAFLSAVLPSLPTAPATNAMGLPKSTPATPAQGLTKKNLKPLPLVTDDVIRENKAALVKDLERRLHFRDDVNQQSSQQYAELQPSFNIVLSDHIDLFLAFQNACLNHNHKHFALLHLVLESIPYTFPSCLEREYRISSFEQRLMNEIEFRLERTPVDESDDEVQHEEIPTGKYIAPIFDKRLKHFRVTEGSPITFTCKIVGIPVPKVYWFKDGKQISKKNPRFKMNREEDGTCSLHIEASTNDDDGNYTIMAANPQGRISCSGHLMVQSIPIRGRISTIQPHRTRPWVPEGDKEAVQERFFRPYFLQAPGDMVAHEGRLCRLDCKVCGLPTPDLTWLLNGKPVLPDGTHKMLVRETGVHSLLIDPLSQNDAGTYTCLATNKTGQNSFSLELTVVAKEVKKAPMFLEKLQNCGVPEGYPVRLECRVVGMPPPIFYWKKDNETIPTNRERMSMHQDTTGYVCLLIQPARKADAGWYTLSAKNEAGIVSCTARLDIYAQWHHQIPQPIKLRPGGSWYANPSGQGLDMFSAFPTTESPMLFSSSPQKVVESEEL
ncbi:Mypn [Columba guinea]|nr:Mypn [Columba guinea]